MSTVHFRGRGIERDRRDVLRDVLRTAGESPHNGRSSWFNYRGSGLYGACAVRVRGPAICRTKRGRRRLRFPPHGPDSRLRLACQTVVLGDLRVEKCFGFWGQRVGAGESETGIIQDAEGTQEPTN